jgi:hypothetical protein
VSITRQNLIAVLRETQAWLSRPGNDFAWSSWNSASEGCAELSLIIAQLKISVQLPEKLNLSGLFAPTGPIQEVSVSSGWGKEFLELASSFDAALEEAYRAA